MCDLVIYEQMKKDGHITNLSYKKDDHWDDKRREEHKVLCVIGGGSEAGHMTGAELIQRLRQWRFKGHVALIGHFDHQMQDTAERLVDGYGLKWAGTLTSPHLTMELIAQQLGLELLHVPYKGSADLMQSILGGQIMAAADSTGFAPQVEAGKLRVLNTWGAERLAKFPDAPTLKELGLNLVQNSPFGIGAPKGTPDAVVKRLHDAFKQAMEQESYKTALARYDMVPMYMSTAAYKKFAQDTFTREKALVEKLGLAKPT